MQEWQTWDSVPFDERECLPETSGICFVVDSRDQVWYVGKATNLKSRWVGRNHHRFPELSRSHSRRRYRIHWHCCPSTHLDKLEKEWIKRYNPILNESKVKTYSLGKPQLKCEITTADGQKDFVFFRGSYEPYEGIGNNLGIYPCTPEDEDNIALLQAQVVRRKYAFNVVVYYTLKGQSKRQPVLCSLLYAGNLGRLAGHPYKGGVIDLVRPPMRAYFY